MSAEPQSGLLSVPAELRLEIYSHLLHDGGSEWLAIQNGKTPTKPGLLCTCSDSPQAVQGVVVTARQSTRTRYHVMEHVAMCQQRCYETTYCLAKAQHSSAKFHTAIMAVCRLLYHEAADILYGKHCFDFGPNIEAVIPFLTDRTVYTRSLVTRISVHKRGPFPSWGYPSHKNEWTYMCRFIAELNILKRLRIVVEGGKPSQQWKGAQYLSESDIRLLSFINLESVGWIKDLQEIKGLDELQIVPDIKYMPKPESTAMIVYAALSVSLEDGLLGFLGSEMSMASGGKVIGSKQ